MKKIALLLSLLLILLLAGKNIAQNLVCNDLTYFALNENCAHTIVSEEILEGTNFSNCVVELDKTAPFGNGPWVAPVLGPADINKTYQVRIRHIPSGNMCWGNVKAEDKLPPVLKCVDLSTVNLNGGGPVSVAATDLSVTATDGCSNVTLTPLTFQFDCADLGVNTIQLTATDQAGNSSTCLHSVLVTNSTNCLSCVSVCPPSVTVSFDEGNLNLLPAFQNNNWTPFDAFGNALFDVGCTYVDSTYTIDYQAGTAGQSWYSRQWNWTNGAGQTVTCAQAIVFPSTHKVTVQGNVYLDASDNCIADPGEQGVNFFGLVVTKLPSGIAQTIFPNPDGSYAVDLEFGLLDVSAEIHLALPPNINPVCPNALNIPNSSSIPLYNFDIGLQSDGNCPRMQVDIGNLVTRRCATNYFQVEYCNVGLDTAYGAFVTVNLDPLIHIVTADLPFTVSGPEELYTFQVGAVAPFQCGSILISAAVSCNAVLGQTLCNDANVYPDAPCNGTWQGAEVVALAQCGVDSVELVLWNKGPQNMTLPLNYIVVEDFIMYKDGTFQLNAGDSITIKVPSNGATWRIEAQQTPGFPISGLVAAAIEGCGGLNIPGLINVFGQTDNALNYDQDCSQVIGAFDPNDKTAVPVGFGNQHIIRKNEAIEYKIRFQNTGTDTAFQVLIVDTLPAMLDAQTLELGASSHPYRLDIYPGGILHFVFQPIALPDSNVNEPASHGYLQFRIAQLPDLADGTQIENQAAIYFDQNDPVYTNTAYHTIGYPFIPNVPFAQVAQIQAPSCSGAADASIIVAASGGVAPYSFHWSNASLQGDSLVGLTAGTYQLTLTDSHGGELVQTFELADPAPITLSLNATPVIGNDPNGAVTAVVSGGTGDYAYSWNNGATSATILDLTPGTYVLVVTDANGCTQSNVAEVFQTVLPLVHTTQIVDLLCNGAANGAIYLTVSGGLMPYTYHWSDANVQGDSPTGLSAGIYHLTITDSFGGELLETFEIAEPAPITLGMNATATLGNDNTGTASALVSGGTGAYTYLWSNGATTMNISGLSAGVYTLVVTDANACTQGSEVEVTQTVLPLVQTAQIVDPTCFGAENGAIYVTVSGGLTPYSFLWSDPNLQGDSITGLASGAYSLTLSDNFGNQVEEIFVLAEPAPILIAMGSTPAVGTQNNGTASAMVSGGASGYTYLWNTGATTDQLSGLIAGTYTVIVTDANGCTESDVVVVDQLVTALEPEMLSRIQVWPNPAHGQLMIDLHQVLPQMLRLDVLGAEGRLLRQFNANELQPRINLNLGNEQSAGIILLVFYDRDGGICTKKILIQ